MRHIKRLYKGITSPYNAIPSAPRRRESIMENIKPNIPVVRFERIKKNEFL